MLLKISFREDPKSLPSQQEYWQVTKSLSDFAATFVIYVIVSGMSKMSWGQRLQEMTEEFREEE